MFRTPKVIGILSFRDGLQNKKMTSFVFPYILEFEIVKSANDMATKAYVKLPNNLSYQTKVKRPTFSEPLAKTINETPSTFFSGIQQVTSGLQVWDAKKLDPYKNNPDNNYWVDVASIAGKPGVSPLLNTSPLINYGQRYSYVNNMDWGTFREFKRDGIIYDEDTQNKETPIIKKVYPKPETDITELFKIGDLFTLR
jgi:hypothetical protein